MNILVVGVGPAGLAAGYEIRPLGRHSIGVEVEVRYHEHGFRFAPGSERLVPVPLRE